MSNIIRIGVASPNPTVGAVHSNTDMLVDMAYRMAVKEVTLGVFPELCFSGYYPEDLLRRPDFIEAQWRACKQFAASMRSERCEHLFFVVGVAVLLRGHVYNCAAVIKNGRIVGIVPKEQLPEYGPHYEQRVFTAGYPGLYDEIPDGEGPGIPFGDLVFDTPFGLLSVDVCEDLWVPDGPLHRRASYGALVHANVSASPYRLGVMGVRREQFATRSGDNLIVLAYSNQVGGNDSLVFDGGGFVFQNGRLLHEAPRFTESWSFTDVDLGLTESARLGHTTWRNRAQTLTRTEAVPRMVRCRKAMEIARRPKAPTLRSSLGETTPFPPIVVEEELGEAIQLGLVDYFIKNRTANWKRFLVAFSGGRDSALALIDAWRAANALCADLPERDRKAQIREMVVAVSLPTHHNSEETKRDARALAKELGVTFFEYSIQDVFQLLGTGLAKTVGAKSLKEATLENLQPRVRATIMWTLSGELNGLWVHSGNKSEVAVGYTTIGGDNSGGYSVTKDLHKRQVEARLVFEAERYSLLSVRRIMSVPASAELKEGQEDERDLMPFALQEDISTLFAEHCNGLVDTYLALRAKWTDERLALLDPPATRNTLKEWVIKWVRLYYGNVFKWEQSPQGVRVSNHPHDRKRNHQLPVVHRLEWLTEAIEALNRLAV